MTKKKKRTRLGLIHLLTFAIIVYLVSVFWNQRNLMKNLQSQEEENILVNKSLEEEILQLEKEIEESQTLQFVEKVAREELGMVKPKEIIVIDKNKEDTSLFQPNKR